jgi:two-component system response regulator HydG
MLPSENVSLVDNPSRGRVLVIDALPELRDRLTNDSYQVEWIDDPTKVKNGDQRLDFDAVLLDLDAGPGLELCRHLTRAWPDTPVVVMTEHNDLETVVGAMRSGAYDFMTKPVVTSVLQRSVERAIRHRVLRCRLRRLTAAVEINADGIVGSSPGMRHLYVLIGRVAETDANVLISGESGTGKELVAKAIHHRSARRDHPFVAINCGAVPPLLLESELFGHVKGSFTSARASRNGLFVHAGGGTILLDEIGEMPMEMQAKLLRVLQERTIRPVGGETEIPYDARVIAATHRDLDKEVAEGRFREDLFYRINVVQVEVPPLRARGSDALVLAEYFARVSAERLDREVPTISAECARKLLQYNWPGNVRELENAIERAVALGRTDSLGVKDLPEKIAQFTSTAMPSESESWAMPTLEELERSYINRVLAAVEGNKTRAAQVLGLDRRTLYRRLEKLAARS